MASAKSFLVTCTCFLLFAGGQYAATGSNQGLARKKELPWKMRAEESAPARRTRVKGASTRLVPAKRRELAARLGGAPKGSSPAKGAVKGAVHPADAAALLKAAAQWFDAGTTDDRNLLGTWNVKRPCSQWFGVTCDSATHRVTAITLPGAVNSGTQAPQVFSLEGPFPAELGFLPELRSLILSGHQLSFYYEVLDLNGLPKAWARLAKLSHLDLSYNGNEDLFKPVPVVLCNLTSLTYLSLAGVRLDFAHLPKQFKSLKKLAWLDLSWMTLGSGDIQTLGSLTRLTTLFLRGCDLSTRSASQFSALGQLHGLKQLDLSSSTVDDGFFKNFSSFPTNLEDLRMCEVVSDLEPMPSWLGRLKQLTSLDLSSNSFTGSLPTQLGALSKLAKLVLTGNRLTGTVPRALFNSRSLAHINLSGNKLTGITFGPHASSCLKRLDLSGNKFNGTIPEGLSTLTRLETLSLSGNLLSGAVPQFIYTMATLTKLDLSSNSFTGLGPSSQQIKAGRLKRLDLSSNNFRGPIPKGLIALVGVTYLSLKKCKITGSIPSWLVALKSLAYLDLSYNQLTGSIPGSIRANLTLKLDHNQLSGNLPARALDLWAQRLLSVKKPSKGVSIGVVNVAWNFLTGPCLRASLPGVRNGSWTRCSEDCEAVINNELLPTLEGNCLQGCKIPGRVITVTDRTGTYELDYVQQHSNAECAKFCGADKRNGPCNSHGSCSLKGPKKTPTCTCSKGFVAPASKPGTCVPGPK